jgi:hypothetical protein
VAKTANEGLTLPNFLVLGAQRAGTTMLHRLLAAHPEVFVPTRRKEVHYFDRYYERDARWYAGYFPDQSLCPTYRAIGEITPDYLADPQVPERIADTLPGCRLIAILRDPVARAFSWYQYSRRNIHEDRPFERFVEEDRTAIEYGLYHKHLGRFARLAPDLPMLVLVYEDVVADPAQATRTLADFLSLSVPFNDPEALLAQRANAAVVPRHRGAFVLARRIGGYLMRHDVNWPSRVAKRLGMRAWFGQETRRPTLEPDVRHRVGARFVEDTALLSEWLQRDLTSLWGLRPAGSGPARAS